LEEGTRHVGPDTESRLCGKCAPQEPLLLDIAKSPTASLGHLDSKLPGLDRAHAAVLRSSGPDAAQDILRPHESAPLSPLHRLLAQVLPLLLKEPAGLGPGRPQDLLLSRP
jgi:hypothetical protein